MIQIGTRQYEGYAPGSIAQLASSTEAALVAQGLATYSSGPVTPGNLNPFVLHGRVGISAGGTQVVVTRGSFSDCSRFIAYLSNASADTTATYIRAIVPAVGSVTFILNAACTAAVAIDWVFVHPSGLVPRDVAL